MERKSFLPTAIDISHKDSFDASDLWEGEKKEIQSW